MQEIWNKVASEKSIYSRLFSSLALGSVVLMKPATCFSENNCVSIWALSSGLMLLFRTRENEGSETTRNLKRSTAQIPSHRIYSRVISATHYPQRPKALEKCAFMTLQESMSNLDAMKTACHCTRSTQSLTSQATGCTIQARRTRGGLLLLSAPAVSPIQK